MSAADDGSKDRIAEFTEFRQRMNQRILGEPNQVVRVGHASPACVFRQIDVFGGDA